MNERTSSRRGGVASYRSIRRAGWVAAGLMIATATLAPAASAASVEPAPINSGNPTCAEFAPEGETWEEFKLESGQLANGVYGDGTLTVTISNYVGSSSGTPGSFDWTANLGVDAVFVKAGSTKHHLYVYDPEATGDTGLGPQAGQGNGISHISFCYDEDPSQEPSEDPSQEPSEEPSQEPSEEPSQEPSEQPNELPSEEPTTSPDGEVLAATGTPTVTLPPTDAVPSVPTSSVDTWRLVLLGLAALMGAALILTPTRQVRVRR